MRSIKIALILVAIFAIGAAIFIVVNSDADAPAAPVYTLSEDGLQNCLDENRLCRNKYCEKTNGVVDCTGETESVCGVRYDECLVQLPPTCVKIYQECRAYGACEGRYVDCIKSLSEN